MSVKSVRIWGLGAAAILAVMACVGCGSRGSDPRMEEALKTAGQRKDTIYPLGGRVTIDGGPLAESKQSRLKFLVLLYNLDKPKADPETWEKTEVQPDGDFHFSHYAPGDGVPPGNYVFVFTLLTDKKKKGLFGPDQLKNLYNDPEKNEKKEGFKIEHKAPGKTDYAFDLVTAGQEEGQAGPKAVTRLRN
jgi:hypothetical protein